MSASAEQQEGRTAPLRSTHLPPTPESVPAARHFAADAVIDLGGEDKIAETELLVSELATNAVLHAATPMRVSVRCNGPSVRVEVRDDDPTLPEARIPDPLAPGGRGIMLVELLATRWGVNHNERGKTVWFELADED
jgi:anti-sigma regulatory factor (Ser/Thr protein kinase)